ncbi:hypothetical protein ACFW4W_37590, partial [Streptomyces mutabilis]
TFHRTRIILHELAHLWWGDSTEASLEELIRLLPGFPPGTLRHLSQHGRVLTRHRYDSPVERRAEMLAGLLHHEAYAFDPIDDPVLQLLDEDLSRLSFLHRPGGRQESRACD